MTDRDPVLKRNPGNLIGRLFPRGLLEVELKTFCLLLVLLFCATSLHAEKVSVLTELEMLQEKLWYLQRDVGANKAALAEQQKQLKGMAAGISKDRQELNDRLSAMNQAVGGQQELRTGLDALTKGNAQQQEQLTHLESGLVQLGEALSALTAEVKQQGGVFADQANEVSTLGKSMETLRTALATQQSGAGQDLGELRKQLEEVRAQLLDTRARINELEQGIGGQVKQLGYWGAGAALVFCIILTFVVALRKERRGRHY